MYVLGTSMASFDGVMVYLSLMKEKIIKDNSCESNGIDQGIHNVFVYDGVLKNNGVEVVLLSLEEGNSSSISSFSFLVTKVLLQLLGIWTN